MAKFAYRCMRCRKRKMLIMRIEHYTRMPKCDNCGWWRFYWDKERNARARAGKARNPCYCSGFPYPHRPGVRFCEKSSTYELDTRVYRYGEVAREVIEDMNNRIQFEGGRLMSPEEDCPF